MHTVGERCYTSSLVGTASFSPKLELEKVTVTPLALRRFHRAMVEYDKPAGKHLEELTDRQPSMIVSIPLTESLRRFISKVLRERRKEQLESLRKRKRPDAQNNLSWRLTCTLPRRRERRINSTRPLDFALKDSKTRAATTSDKRKLQRSKQSTLDRTTCDLDCQLESVQSAKEVDISEYPLEIQPDAIITLQVDLCTYIVITQGHCKSRLC